MDTNIMFSDSNLYFQNTEALQSSVGFVGITELDTYVKQSFSAIQDNVIVTGGYIQTLNKDHMIDEFFNCYKIELANKQPILASQGIIKFDLENSGRQGSGIGFIKGLIQGTPFISIILLTLISFVFPPYIANILRRISIIGLIITVLFYAYKVGKMIYKILTSKGKDYYGINIHYENDADILHITPEYVETLKILRTKLKIQQIVLLQGQFYLKQMIKKTTIRQSIKNVFVGQTINEQANQELIQNTINFLISTSFISSHSAVQTGQPTS